MTLSLLSLLSPTQGTLSEALSILASRIAVPCLFSITLRTIVTLCIILQPSPVLHIQNRDVIVHWHFPLIGPKED